MDFFKSFWKVTIQMDLYQFPNHFIEEKYFVIKIKISIILGL